MSSYIHFFLVEKSDNQKKHLVSFQSCNKIYEIFSENRIKNNEDFHPISIQDIEYLESLVNDKILELKKLKEKQRRVEEKTQQAIVEALGIALANTQSEDSMKRILKQASENLFKNIYDNESNEDEDLVDDFKLCLSHLNLLSILLYEMEYSSEWSGICYTFD